MYRLPKTIDELKYLRESVVEISIFYIPHLQQYKKDIIKYSSEQKQFRLLIDFWNIILNKQDRQKIIDWINREDLWSNV